MADWQTIWSRRQAPAVITDTLQMLIDLDGFDSGAGRVTADAWRAYAVAIGTQLGLQASDSVFEVGCGSGAFLFALREQGAHVAGLDYAANLVEVAKRTMAEGQFLHSEARAIEPVPQSDFVIANGVFHYFVDETYAQDVLTKMLSKARRAVAVLEVPDLALREESERVRRDILTPIQYEEKYRDLPHQYYDRSWFTGIAADQGFNCQTFDQNIEGYAQSHFRFNCLMTRTSA